MSAYVVMWEETDRPVAHRDTVLARSKAEAMILALSGHRGFVFSVTEA